MNAESVRIELFANGQSSNFAVYTYDTAFQSEFIIIAEIGIYRKLLSNKRMVRLIAAVIFINAEKYAVIEIFFGYHRKLVVKFIKSCEMIALGMIFFTCKLSKIAAKIDIIRAVPVKFRSKSAGIEFIKHIKLLICNSCQHQRITG